MGRSWRMRAGRGRAAHTLGWTLVALTVSLTAAAGASADELVTRVFSSTGAEQTFVVPQGVTSMQLRAAGAHGFNEEGGHSLGAEVNAEVAVTPGQELYIEVGGNGSGAQGGFNGGGDAVAAHGSGAVPAHGGGGGTDIRTAPRSAGLSPDTRFIVAGGGAGGGSGVLNGSLLGGDAGEEGESGRRVTGGLPGTQTAGGEVGEGFECSGFNFHHEEEIPGSDGSLGLGGEGAACLAKTHGSAGGGGGGGGLYGGGGGGAFFEEECGCGGHIAEGGGGGGGSSLVPAGGTLALASGTSEPVVELTFEQPENPPAVITEAASGVSVHTATLNATVQPEGSEVTSCRFEYGTTTAYGLSVPCSSTPGSGFRPVGVSAAIEGLTPKTTYHYRIVATNGVGTSFGADREFATPPPPPTVEGEPATEVTAHSATLNAVVDPNGGEVIECFFKYGRPSSLTLTAPCSPSPGGGVSPVDVSASVTGLEEGATYEYILVVRSEGGRGAEIGERFTTASRPRISGVSPREVSAHGGATVHITGRFFADTTEVLFGANPAEHFEVNAEGTEIVAVAPAGTGKVPVVVTTPAGTEEGHDLEVLYVPSATAPEFGVCDTTGDKAGFEFSSLTKECDGFETKTARAQWFPVGGAVNLLEKAHFTTAGSSLTLESEGKQQITCASESSGGEYSGAKALSGIVLKLTGCRLNASESCQSAGAAAGEVLSDELAGTLGVVQVSASPTKTKLGLALGPASGETFAELSCGADAVVIRGSAAAPLKTDKMLTQQMLKFKATKGTQKPAGFEGGAPAALEMRIGDESFERTGLTVTATQTNEEAVEVNSVL